eukprot:362384-Chlamydomonas_euryale.AAC.1
MRVGRGGGCLEGAMCVWVPCAKCEVGSWGGGCNREEGGKGRRNGSGPLCRGPLCTCEKDCTVLPRGDRRREG